MAGFGAPLVWQVNKAALPSVTVWSNGGNVNVGETPETKRLKRKGAGLNVNGKENKKMKALLPH